MPRSLVSRSLAPLVGLLWGVFLFWSAWLAAVWLLPVSAQSLRLIPGDPSPPDAALRSAVLILADNADVAWLTLAVMNLHLVLTDAHGLRTARAWLAFSGGAALVFGALNARWGPFPWHVQFGGALGVQLFNVAVGWVLLWAVAVMAAREAVLRFRPRMSHRGVAAATALVVTATMANLDWPGRFIRGWWAWLDDDGRGLVSTPLLRLLACLVYAWLTAFALREKNVVSGAAVRSWKPVIILLVLNAAAVAARLRVWAAN